MKHQKPLKNGTKGWQIVIFTASLVFSINNLNAQSGTEIIGVYRLPNKLDVEIYNNNGVFYGKIVALNNFENGQLLDINNPDTKNHNNPITNLIIIKDLQYNSKLKQWIGGKMYAPDKGINVDLKILKHTKDQVTVEGSKFLFSKTIEWKKLR